MAVFTFNRGLLMRKIGRVCTCSAPMRSIRLPPMPTIRDLLLLYKLQAQKRLSQNFLLDLRLINKIAKASSFKSRPLQGFHAVEVGPGPGGITRALLNNGADHITVIEKDPRFKPLLEMLAEASEGRLTIYWGDVLSFDMSKMFPEEMRLDWAEGELYLDQEREEWTVQEEEETWRPHRGQRVKGRIPKMLLVGNLPFNISTPLVVRWMKDISNRANIWSYGRVPLTLTFQKEVAERIVAKVGEEQRCRLSVMCQNWCYVDHKFDISGSAFIPKPKVDVGVVRLVPRPEPIIPLPFAMVEKVLRTFFSYRQKFIKHAAANLFPPCKGDEGSKFPSREDMVDEFFLISGVNPNIRAFRTTLEEFKRLCGAYQKMCERYPGVEKFEYRGPKGLDFTDDFDEEKLEKKWEGFDDAVGKFDQKLYSSVHQ
ncbi:dimethyladenosine transferase 1, mitochondrial [Ischnura elegans]|uniref:dimethyladenosine transferase 1, mitochondrial n=1 Tax=Ischnura elegans TaxID=197161 RepID=UPI001ED868C8|nr:dimethyladenosine transferase 1, mitochondrial [Ischnura elegans]